MLKNFAYRNSLLTGPMLSDPCRRSMDDPIHIVTPGRRQSKMLSIDECGSKIDRNRVFDCHLSPHWRQMAIENSDSIFDSFGVFKSRLPGVVMWLLVFSDSFSRCCYLVCSV